MKRHTPDTDRGRVRGAGYLSIIGFTEPALDECSAHPLRNLLLWRKSDVDLALRSGMRAALGIKWRKAVEDAVMDYELEEEDFR